MSYADLKRILNFNVGINWFIEDAKDDFFPDPIRYQDIKKYQTEFLNRTQHTLLNHRLQPPERYDVPKANFLIREAISLKPQSRIIYLSLLHKLAPALNPTLARSTYSYRLPANIDVDAGQYPYPTTFSMGQWHEFINDFRKAALSDDIEYAIVTDLANYYEHIRIDRFCETLRALLPKHLAADTELCLGYLRDLLDSFSTTGYGVPQNYDPSSFFCSAFLSVLDHSMLREGLIFFRYVDDMRMVAKTKGEARDALHRLQVFTRSLGMFLSSAKTKVYKKGTPEFENLMDVSDDVVLSEYEEKLRSQDKAVLSNSIPKMISRLRYHEETSNDDRKFRAFANQLLKTAEFYEFREQILPVLKGHALTRMRTYPERSDRWARLLSPEVDVDVQRETLSLLQDKDYAAISWQRMWLLETVLRAGQLYEASLMDEARKISERDPCSYVRGRALLVRGKYGDHAERERIANDFYQMNAPIDVKRAVVLAIQEMHHEQRDGHYQRFLRVDNSTAELIRYIQESEIVRYSSYEFQKKKLREKPRKVVAIARRGIGLVNHQPVRFRIALSDTDYE